MIKYNERTDWEQTTRLSMTFRRQGQLLYRKSTNKSPQQLLWAYSQRDTISSTEINSNSFISMIIIYSIVRLLPKTTRMGHHPSDLRANKPRNRYFLIRPIIGLLNVLCLTCCTTFTLTSNPPTTVCLSGVRACDSIGMPLRRMRGFTVNHCVCKWCGSQLQSVTAAAADCPHSGNYIAVEK